MIWAWLGDQCRIGNKSNGTVIALKNYGFLAGDFVDAKRRETLIHLALDYELMADELEKSHPSVEPRNPNV